jgi:Regulator of chromosome condensation (RCC1) repeat
MSSRKRKPESSEDRNDNDTPSSIVSVGRERKNLKAFAKVSVGNLNPSFVKLKEALYQMAHTDLMENAEGVLDGNNRLPKAEDLQPGEHPHFVQASIVNLRWKLAEQRDLYARPTGDVIGFGMDDAGQLGLILLEKDDGFPPTLVVDLGSRGIIQVAGGGLHSLGITESGSAYSWGSGDEGQLGRLFDADSDVDQLTPTQITKMHPSKHAVSRHTVRSPHNECSDVIAIDAGGALSIFLTISGNVYVSGM